MTYLPYTVFSGGRTQFIRIITFLIVVGGIFYLQKNEWRLSSVLNVIKAGFWGIIAFLCIFVAVGSLKNSTIVESAFSTVSFYTGMSIPSLDDYFLHPRPDAELFGSHTLTDVYSFLNKFGYSYPDSYPHYDFVNFNGTSGNVYTIIRRYHEDFGLWGLYGLMFFLGIFYGIFFLLASKRSGFSVILYGYFAYTLVMVSIDEQFLLSYFNAGTVAIVGLLFCFYHLFCDKKIKNDLYILFNYSYVDNGIRK